MFKERGIEIGRKETVAPSTVDLSAQLSALKDTGSDTLIMTSGVEQLTLGIRQAAEQQLPQRIVTTGGSFPEPLLESPGPKGYTSSHLLFFSPGRLRVPFTQRLPAHLWMRGTKQATPSPA